MTMTIMIGGVGHCLEPEQTKEHGPKSTGARGRDGMTQSWAH